MLFRSLAATPKRRLAQTAALMNGIPASSNGVSLQGAKRRSLRDLPKTNVFTSNLPADPTFPSPKSSHGAPREDLGPRPVNGALYTYVRPETVLEPELLGVSSRAMADIGIQEGDERTEDFKDTVAGNRILTWDESMEDGQGIYPWAQCYGGYQFGSWASQLGDGRAISLFETRNPSTNKRYELQLKGAGLTPYSRFADGKAVLRSSIREYIVSEALNALGIPSTRALSLTLLPKTTVRRERPEPGAIVARFAESWLRIGTFDLLRARGQRRLTRQLATYAAENVFSGWENLPARIPIETPNLKDTSPEALTPSNGIAQTTTEGPEDSQENRFTRLYREIARRNAATVAYWQAYGFMNGVLNTDNTSILGLSIDFGPFAFMDTFDPNYTPNHDDHMLRYSYRNQPTIIWWNLVRLGEDLGELIGAGAKVDDQDFVEKGLHGQDEDAVKRLVHRAETIIQRTGQEYRAVFLARYKDLMARRLGLKQLKDSDFDALISDWLDTLEALELDLNHSFRTMSSIRPSDIDTPERRRQLAARFFHAEGATGIGETDDSARDKIATWLESWRARVLEDWGDSPAADEEREARMKEVNPKFLPRSWVLDELIERVEKKGEREILGRVMEMSLRPFQDRWGWDEGEEERFCGDVPRYRRAMQCSCSS